MGKRLTGPALWWGVFLCFGLLYALTAQRGCGWLDAGEYQWRMLKGIFRDDFPLCSVHPLYYMLGRFWTSLFPKEHVCLALNLFSGIGMAIALANFALLAHYLTRRPVVSALLACVLGVSHAAWWLATIAEVYTWSLAGLSLELLLLLGLLRQPLWGRLAILALVNGLGLSLHNGALLSIPVYGAVVAYLLVRRRLPHWAVASVLAAWFLGIVPLLVLLAQELWGGRRLPDALTSWLVGEVAGKVLIGRIDWLSLVRTAVLSALSFLNILLPFAVVGVISLAKHQKPLFWVLVLMALLQMAFFLRYNVPDQFMFILPTLLFAGLFAAIGIATVLERTPRAAPVVLAGLLLSIFLPPLVYGLAPSALKSIGVRVARDNPLPLRDDLRYWITPWKHTEKSAEHFALSALAEAAPRSLLLSEHRTVFPLLLTQAANPQFRDISVPHFRKQERHLKDSTKLREYLFSHSEWPIFTTMPLKTEGGTFFETLHTGVLFRVSLKDQ